MLVLDAPPSPSMRCTRVFLMSVARAVMESVAHAVGTFPLQPDHSTPPKPPRPTRTRRMTALDRLAHTATLGCAHDPVIHACKYRIVARAASSRSEIPSVWENRGGSAAADLAGKSLRALKGQSAMQWPHRVEDMNGTIQSPTDFIQSTNTCTGSVSEARRAVLYFIFIVLCFPVRSITEHSIYFILVVQTCKDTLDPWSSHPISRFVSTFLSLNRVDLALALGASFFVVYLSCVDSLLHLSCIFVVFHFIPMAAFVPCYGLTFLFSTFLLTSVL